MTKTETWHYCASDNFAIDPVNPTKGRFELDVDYSDTHYGNSTVSLDALEVYGFLQSYFKGTQYE